MRRAYHGSTHGSMSMMGAPEGEEWKGAFRPLLPDVQAIEFNDFGELERITRRTACVLAEPVQGEAGVRPPVPGYLEAPNQLVILIHSQFCGRFLFDYFSDADDADKNIKNLRHPRQSDSKYKFSDKLGEEGLLC